MPAADPGVWALIGALVTSAAGALGIYIRTRGDTEGPAALASASVLVVKNLREEIDRLGDVEDELRGELAQSERRCASLERDNRVLERRVERLEGRVEELVDALAQRG